MVLFVFMLVQCKYAVHTAERLNYLMNQWRIPSLFPALDKGHLQMI